MVFDCIYNTTVKSRTLRDPEFKIFLVGQFHQLFRTRYCLINYATELALQRIEAQTSLALSRNIGTPNIASKGKLLPRTVQIPAAMLPALTGAPSASQTPTQLPSKPLIQEVSSTTNGAASSPTSTDKGANAGDATPLPGLRGILKKPGPSTSGSSTANATEKGATPIEDTPLDWSWIKDDEARLRVEVHVPGLVSSINPSRIPPFFLCYSIADAFPHPIFHARYRTTAAHTRHPWPTYFRCRPPAIRRRTDSEDWHGALLKISLVHLQFDPKR